VFRNFGERGFAEALDQFGEKREYKLSVAIFVNLARACSAPTFLHSFT
jgi:hypothetical protein